MLIDIVRLAKQFNVFSKLSLVNLISKDANLVFYLSVYPLVHSIKYLELTMKSFIVSGHDHPG